jgi:hypothetical protein
MRCRSAAARLAHAPAHARAARDTQVYELDGADAKLLSETEHKHAFKCGTFGASLLSDRCAAAAAPACIRAPACCACAPAQRAAAARPR